MYSNEAVLDKEDNRTASALPEPCGYRLLIALPKIEEKTEGGIYRPDSLLKAEEVATIVGFVLKVGDLAYADEKKFPTGPWCKQGDWVVFRAYSGTRIKIFGQEFRIINDDSVEAVVADPRGVQRA